MKNHPYKFNTYTWEVFSEKDGVSYKVLEGRLDENRDCFSPEHLQAGDFPAKNMTEAKKIGLRMCRQYAVFHMKAIYE